MRGTALSSDVSGGFARAWRSRPVAFVVGDRALHVGTDTGEWGSVAAGADELATVAATGPFAAAIADASGTLTVACFGPSVKQLRDGAWTEVALGAVPLALACTARGIVAGDAGGGLALVTRIAVQELASHSPIVDLYALGDALVVLGARGTLETTAWPFRDGAPLVAIDTHAIGRPHALHAGPRPGTALVVGDAGYGVLDPVAFAATVADVPGIRGTAAFAHRDRAFVFADDGTSWIADAGLVRVARPRVANVVGAAATPAGTVLAWTAAGELHLVAFDGAARRVAELDVAIAAPDPDRADGYLAIHWSPDAEARVSRGRTAWT